MLVICEECAKKYDIDISKMKGEKAYFPCRKCSHQIVVKKPTREADSPPPVVEEPQAPEEEIAEILQEPKPTITPTEKKEKGRGIPVVVYFMVPILLGLLVVNGAFCYLYFDFTPKLIYKQVDLRSATIASFLQESDILQLSQQADLTTKMPDVAYIAVIDPQGVATVGVFGDASKFAADFNAKFQQEGFPAQALKDNRAAENHLGKNSILTMGGQKVYDKAISLENIDGELHVGIFVSNIDKTLWNALLSPTLLIVAILPWICGLTTFTLLARYITNPLKDLTAIVHRISLGELDLTVETNGPRELRDFARAFERMRYSIREAINRLKSN